MPYGFPSGKDLKQQIINVNSGSFVSSFGLSKPLEEDHRIECRRFCNELKLSAQPSVDTFLEHRPDFMPLGKLLIAYVLISYENTNNLVVNDDWYQFLWQQMGTRFDEFHKNNLSIITFNYDRSLEHFLLTVLVNSYGISEQDAAEKLKQIPIVHVYGQLGLLEWQANDDEKADVRPYGIERTYQTIKIASRGIQILSEGQGESEQFRNAHDLLIAAKRVYFLGFGYNETNMKRLKVPLRETQWHSNQRQIIGSSYLRTAEENNVTKDKYPGLELRSEHFPTYEFLRHEQTFLRP